MIDMLCDQAIKKEQIPTTEASSGKFAHAGVWFRLVFYFVLIILTCATFLTLYLSNSL
jgi:hypothetical protein